MDNAQQDQQPGAGLVLHRLIAQRDRLRGPRPQDLPSTQTARTDLGRAAATALGRAAQAFHRLPVFVEKVEFGEMSLPELGELLPERALLSVVEAAHDQLGVVAICPALLASLIEMQALGRVTSRKPAPRRATRTDAAISADFVNAFLAEISRELGYRPDYPTFGAFRYTTFLDDPRPLALMLEDGEMLRLSLRFRIGPAGQRDGTLMLALPAPKTVRTPASSGQMLALPPSEGVPSDAVVPDLSHAVQQAPIRLVGVLCRRKLSLRTLRELVPGALIPLGPNVLDEARLETPLGHLVAQGRLGEAEGFHAIRPHLGDSANAQTPATVPMDGIPTALHIPVDDLGQHDAFRLASGAQAPQKTI